MQSNKADKKGLKIYITCKRHFKRPIGCAGKEVKHQKNRMCVKRNLLSGILQAEK